MILLLADICTITAAMIFFAIGIAYFYKSKTAKHHCSTIQNILTEANNEDKFLMFALMRGICGGAIAIAVFTCWLQLQYSKQGEHWMALIIVIVDLLFCIFSLTGMLLVKRNTKVKPPVYLLYLVMLLIITGYFLNVL